MNLSVWFNYCNYPNSLISSRNANDSRFNNDQSLHRIGTVFRSRTLTEADQSLCCSTYYTIWGDMCMISIARTVSWSSILQSKIGNLKSKMVLPINILPNHEHQAG
jgi:hypothetical protein